MAISGAQEVYKKISSLVSSQFPEFIRDDGPLFVSFLKAYYEFMEESGAALTGNRSHLDNQDIDRTLDSFVEYFRREFMVNIPKSTLADKRLLAKHIRDFYRTRGAQNSYRFLFRAIYGKEIEFYYPRDDILRVSAGRWVKETIVRVSAPFSAVPTIMEGRVVTGATSGAIGTVQSILNTLVTGISIYELTLENVTGSFVDGETITDSEGVTASINNSIGALTGLTIIDTTSAFNVNEDTIRITASGSSPANGNISATTDLSGITFRIVNPGSGYRIACTTYGVSGPGTGGAFTISSLSNTTSISINSDTISALRNVPLNTGLYFITGGGNTAAVSANMAGANVTSVLSAKLVFSSVTIGSINAISMTSPGKGYSTIPTITVVDQVIADTATVAPYYSGFKGKNAVVVANNAFGAVTAFRLNSVGSNFNKNETLTITNDTRGSASMTETSTDKFGQTRTLIRNKTYLPSIRGNILGVNSLAGRYLDTSGFLSWNNKLQDGALYQDFAYVVRVSKLVNDYRNIIKKVLHPAGTKFIGFYQIDSTLDVGSLTTIDTVINNETLDVSVSFNISHSETVTLAETPAATAIYSAASAESVTPAGTPAATATYPAASAETVTPSETLSAARFALYASIQMNIQYANNIISVYQAQSITSYAGVPVNALDGNPRLVTTAVGTTYFACTSPVYFWANTGSVRLGGYGSNVMFTSVGSTPANTTIYTINTIFSNTAFTLRTNYLPIHANTTFSYQVVT